MYTDEVWNDVLSFDEIFDAVECISVVFLELIDLLIPLYKVRVKQHASPLAANSEVIAARHKRNKAYRLALRTGDPLFW